MARYKISTEYAEIHNRTFRLQIFRDLYICTADAKQADRKYKRVSNKVLKCH